MAVLFAQHQAPDTGLYSIPLTDCTEKPSDKEDRGRMEGSEPEDRNTQLQNRSKT